MSRVLIFVSLASAAVAIFVPADARAQAAQQQQPIEPAGQGSNAPQQQPAQQPAGQQPAGQQQIMIVEHGSTQQQQAAPEPEVRTRARTGLIIGGAVMFGVSYIAHAAIISPLAGIDVFETSFDEVLWNDFRYLGAIPLVGPWLQLANKPTSFTDDGWGTYLIINGLLQTAGLTMVILGFVLRKETSGYADASPSLMVAPMAAEGAAGLTAFGRF